MKRSKRGESVRFSSGGVIVDRPDAAGAGVRTGILKKCRRESIRKRASPKPLERFTEFV